MWRVALLTSLLLGSTALAAPNIIGGRGGSSGIPEAITGPGGGPCVDFDGNTEQMGLEEFDQQFTAVRATGWTDGTDDAEFEANGLHITAVGAVADPLFAPNEEGTAGSLMMQPGNVANTGLNLQFKTPGKCTALPCFTPFNIPVLQYGFYGGQDICWTARVGFWIVDPADDGVNETAIELWDSSFVIGFTTTDPYIMAATTGALSRNRAVGGNNLWDGEGCLFHLSRAGALTFNCTSTTTDTITTTGASVSLINQINHEKAHQWPTFIDVGVRLHQSANGADPNDGTIKAYYRVIPLPWGEATSDSLPTSWTQLGSTISGDEVLPNQDNTIDQYFTFEFIQSTTDAEAAPADGLEVFLSSLGWFLTREEQVPDDTYPH